MSITDILAENFPEYFKNTEVPPVKPNKDYFKKNETIRTVSENTPEQRKLELTAYIAGMDKVVNSKTKLAMWIVDNMSAQELAMSQRDIAKATGISLGTVESTMKILQEGESPVLLKSENGTYRLNPHLNAG